MAAHYCSISIRKLYLCYCEPFAIVEIRISAAMRKLTQSNRHSVFTGWQIKAKKKNQSQINQTEMFHNFIPKLCTIIEKSNFTLPMIDCIRQVHIAKYGYHLVSGIKSRLGLIKYQTSHI